MEKRLITALVLSFLFLLAWSNLIVKPAAPPQLQPPKPDAAVKNPVSSTEILVPAVEKSATVSEFEYASATTRIIFSNRKPRSKKRFLTTIHLNPFP